MLRCLHIENVAVIEKAQIDFEKGLTVMTGETGAGKSIIIDSIELIMGKRSSKDIIRTGADFARVTALFDDLPKEIIKKLNEMDIDCLDGDVQIFRDIKSSGKSICKINGVPVTLAMLKEISQKLICVHGQHDSYELLSAEIHCKYLDDYAKLDALHKSYIEKFEALKTIKKQLDALMIDENQKERRIDLLSYQIEEIELADIKPGERERLSKKRETIRNGESISKSLGLANMALNSDEGSIVSALSVATRNIEDAAKNYKDIESLAEKMRDLEYNLTDIAMDIRGHYENLDFNPKELEAVEERLDLLYKLSLKYGENEEEILENLEKYRTELTDIKLSQEKIDLLSDEFEKVKEDAIGLAKDLSTKRKQAAAKFCEKIRGELSFLNMPNVRLEVLQERTALTQNGCDKVEFLVSANKGEDLKPMSKIASGGELSRIMLALKVVLAGKNSKETMVFDEIDAGISGEAGNKVGKKLKDLSLNNQLVCITHLAQIAAMADNHMLIKKKEEKGKTLTNVKTLTLDERIDELARITSGDGITELKRKMAREMLEST